MKQMLMILRLRGRRGRRRNLCKEVVDKDTLDLKLKPGDAMDGSRWKEDIGATVVSGCSPSVL